MSNAHTKWTAENVETATAILSAHTDMQRALDKIGHAVGFDVTRDSVDKAVRKVTGKAAFRWLRTPSVASPQVAASVSAAPRETRQEGAQAQQEPKRERTSDDDLALHRAKLRISELEDAKKRLLADLDDHKDQIAAMRDLAAARPISTVTATKKVGGKQRQGTPVMLCSDWHVEEPVDPAKVNGINEYNLEIAERCIDRLADGFEWMLTDSRYDCRSAVVWLGGDLFSGYIHEELAEGNFLSPTQAVLWLQDRIEGMLRKIAANCPNLERIIVPCNDGNHGRMTHKIRVATRTANSLEWLMYQNLAVRMRDDPRFEFQIAEGEWTFLDLYGDKLAFTHGDSFQYGGGVGGISIPIRRGVSRQFAGQKIAKVCMGHFHQRQDFGDIAINGSLIGPGSYSLRIHAAPEPRQQHWFLWDSERGQSFSAPLWL